MEVVDTMELEAGSFVRSARGQSVGGDLAIIEPGRGLLFLAIVDVLGHGPEAHSNALELQHAITAWKPKRDLLGLMKALHRHQVQARGAAVGLCTIRPANGEVQYVGIGNAVCRIMGDHSHHMLTREGVVGQTMRTPTVEVTLLSPRNILLLYTDGVSSHFEFSEYPQMVSDGVAVAARKIVDRFGKAHDDAGCIAVRYA